MGCCDCCEEVDCVDVFRLRVAAGFSLSASAAFDVFCVTCERLSCPTHRHPCIHLSAAKVNPETLPNPIPPAWCCLPAGAA